jgi:uncharacterized membrane protein YjjP (DUF1212 family)
VNEELNLFLLIATRIGRRYLSCGGPTSRLEEKLSEAGTCYGFRTEVFATPTGIFVSAITRDGTCLATLLDRIKDSTINLTELVAMERLLDRFCKGDLNLKQTVAELESARNLSYPLWLLLIGSFGVGAFSSHMRFGNTTALFLSGLLTMIVYLVTGRFVYRLRVSGIFGDFVGCLVALIGAGLFSQYFDLPPEAFAIGSIVLIVPGLTITTAISELADQNFASGTTKLMKGALTIFAMATAYVLVRELATSALESGDIWYGKSFRLPVQPDWVALVNNAGLILSFAIIFQVPRSALIWATVSGLSGWLVLKGTQLPHSVAVAPFLASMAVGTISLVFSRFLNLPSQIYSVPGILSLLPGMLALSTFTSFGMAQARSGPEVVFSVAIVACSIVFGLFVSRFPFVIMRRPID